MNVILGYFSLMLASVRGHDLTCNDICAGIPTCRNKGSFCKISADNNQVCQGLYFRDLGRTSTCFAEDVTCPQAIPVRCPHSPPLPPSTITCESICAITPACAFSPLHQGTYCKLEQSSPTCFGLFWRDPGRTQTCYWPVDRTCPQDDPVRCG
jgi:hypothetical protein